MEKNNLEKKEQYFLILPAVALLFSISGAATWGMKKEEEEHSVRFPVSATAESKTRRFSTFAHSLFRSNMTSEQKAHIVETVRRIQNGNEQRSIMEVARSFFSQDMNEEEKSYLIETVRIILDEA